MNWGRQAACLSVQRSWFGVPSFLPVHLEDRDGLDAVLDGDGRARVEAAVGPLGGARRGVAQDDLAGQRVLLQTRREVDRVADGRVLRAPLRADVADGRPA